MGTDINIAQLIQTGVVMLLEVAIFVFFVVAAILKDSSDNLPLKIGIYIGTLIGLLILVLRIGWHMVVYWVAASEWDKIRANSLPVIRKTGKTPWASLIWAGVFGIAAALSTLISRLFNIQESDTLKEFLRLFPNAEKDHPPFPGLTGESRPAAAGRPTGNCWITPALAGRE